MSETKLCPFRKMQSGMFMPCIGEACVAYYEYPLFTYRAETYETTPPPVPRCRMMDTGQTPPAYHVSGPFDTYL